MARMELRLGSPATGGVDEAIVDMIRISKLLDVIVISKLNGVDVMVFPTSDVEYTFEQYKQAQHKPGGTYKLASGN